MPATDGTWRVALRNTASGRLIDKSAVASVAIVLALGAFLVMRRAIGAITSSLPPLPLVATAIGLVTWALCIRMTGNLKFSLFNRAAAGELRSPDGLISHWLPALATLLFATACSYPGDRWLDWLVWVPAIGLVVGPWGMSRSLRRKATRSLAPAESEIKPNQLIQQLTRCRNSDGKEIICGTFVAQFRPGERSTTVYVAFCPPFERLPNVEVDVADESSATVKLAQLLHNGAQLDVRLPQAADRDERVTIELIATESESC